jgi:hypothetical protein
VALFLAKAKPVAGYVPKLMLRLLHSKL